MDYSPVRLPAQACLPPPGCGPLSEWTGAISDSPSSTSSPGSCAWSPGDELSFSASQGCLQQQMCALSSEQEARGSLPGHRRERCRQAGSQRHSASEREKLRMRGLSKAVQNLRKYLPTSAAPAGQNLTKIETLRLAIRYIGHLSELLGLSEEALAQRRQEELQQHDLWMKSQDCFQERRQRPPFTSAQYSAFRLSSPECSVTRTAALLPECQAQQDAPWLSSPQCFEVESAPSQLRPQYMDTDTYLASTPCSTATTEHDPGFTGDADCWLSSSLCSKLAHFYHCQMTGSPTSGAMPSAETTLKQNEAARMARGPGRSSANSMLAGLSIPCLQ